jgi:hypothetical protein
VRACRITIQLPCKASVAITAATITSGQSVSVPKHVIARAYPGGPKVGLTVSEAIKHQGDDSIGEQGHETNRSHDNWLRHATDIDM